MADKIHYPEILDWLIMITEEERNSIIQEAVEKATEQTLLLIPETVGNMITNHVTLSKMNSKFYADHPEFKDHKVEVASVVEMIDGKHPFMEYEDILKKAVPEIAQRIKILKSLDTTNVPNTPNRNFERVDAPKFENPHGEL